jgi:hypothetical protein
LHLQQLEQPLQPAQHGPQQEPQARPQHFGLQHSILQQDWHDPQTLRLWRRERAMKKKHWVV